MFMQAVFMNCRREALQTSTTSASGGSRGTSASAWSQANPGRALFLRATLAMERATPISCSSLSMPLQDGSTQACFPVRRSPGWTTRSIKCVNALRMLFRPSGTDNDTGKARRSTGRSTTTARLQSARCCYGGIRRRNSPCCIRRSS